MKFNRIWNEKKFWKWAAVFWGVILIISLIPVIALAFYNFPCADDLGYSIYTKHAWEETHSLLAVLAAAWRKVAESYFTWQGTWTSIFVMALQPAIWGEEWYWIGTTLLIAALSCSGFFFMNVIFHNFLGSEKKIASIASSIYLLVAIQCMTDKTQGLFWYNGASHYIFPWAAFLALMGILMKMTVKEQHAGRKMAAAVLLAVYIGGGNLVTGLECGIWLFLAIGLCVLFRNRGMVKNICIITGFWAVSYGANVAAPGNWNRQEEFTYRPGVIRSVLQSFYYCFDFVFEQWTNWGILLFVFLMLPLVVRAVQGYKGKFSFPCPLLVPIWSYCVLSSMFTPSVYASGNPGAGRIFNTIFLTYLILIVVNLIYLYGWYWMKYGCEKKMEDRELQIWHIAGTLGAAFCLLIVAGVTPERFTSVSAALSLAEGEAEAYWNQEEERLEILRDSSIQDAELKEFTRKPELLFYEDIEPEADNWKNVRMSGYYGKNTVKLIRE